MIRDNLHVEVGTSNTDGQKTAVVTDRVSGRAWSGEGVTDSAAATEAVRKFLGDRRAPEYVKG